MDDVITQLGLLLTQTRFARRALEDIERTTSRYGSFAMTSAAPSGAAFGSPPLLDGALRVHVVNIQDLSPTSGFDIGGIFGGIGAFVGNLFGGIVGGTVGSVMLAKSLGTIQTLAGQVERIIDKLGLGKSAPQPADAAKGAKPETPAAAGGKTDLVEQLDSVRAKFDLATAALRSNGQLVAPATGGSSAVSAPDLERWQVLVDSVTVSLSTATRLVRGLVIAVPLVIAGVAWLFDRLPDFRNAIVDTLRFVVRNALVLTQAFVVMALETVAMIARVAAMAIRTLATIIDEALAALFAALAKLLQGALELGGILAGAITKTVNQLLDWLVPKIDEILRHIGELRVFRLLSRFVDVLPSILVLLGSTPPPPNPDGSGSKGDVPNVTPLKVPDPPDLKAIMMQVGKDAKASTDALTKTAKELVDAPTNVLHKGLIDFGDKLDKEAEKQSSLVTANLAKRLPELAKNADEKTKALLPTEPGTASQNVWDRLRGQTAFHPIAAAYGQWLASGGLTQLLNSMSSYFTNPESPSDKPAARTPATDPVVRIDEVVIDIAPARQQSSAGPGRTAYDADGSLLSRYGSARERVEFEDRSDQRRGLMGQPRPHVPIWDFVTP